MNTTRYFGLVVYSNHNPREAARKLMRENLREDDYDHPDHILARFYGRLSGFTFITVYMREAPPGILARAQYDDSWWDAEPDDED
jgi:hypothetical protein